LGGNKFGTIDEQRRNGDKMVIILIVVDQCMRGTSIDDIGDGQDL